MADWDYVDRDDPTSWPYGSAYVFTRDEAGSWTEKAKLTVPELLSWDSGGHTVAISGEMAVIAAYDTYIVIPGSAYVFTRDGFGTWSQQAKLTGSDSAPTNNLATSVAVSGNTVVIGAANSFAAAAGYSSGAAYVFKSDASGRWTQQAKLTAPDAAEWDYLGTSVAVSGDTIVVGAYDDDDAGSSSGSVYVFDLTCLPDTQETDASDGQDDSQEPDVSDGQNDSDILPAAPMCGLGAVQAMLPSMLLLSLTCCSHRCRRSC